ncbi:MAG: adenosylcobalamin-dependent ribonucleoside-diphosphate reductase [Halieaceae bacterium]
MSNTRSIAEKLDGFSEVPIQATSLDIWQQKYALKDSDGNLLDADIEASYERVARAIAEVETEPDLREQWYRKFLWALRQGAVPAGRILSNAGATEHRANTSTINCTVSGSIGDSMESILNMNTEAGLTLKAGCGIGYEFSTLRPRGARVSGAGARTSGPLSFMEIFDKTCLTVSSAGGRRGAQMATFDVRHPDVLEFIRAKREDGRLRQFNLSLLITDEFIQAVEQDTDWELRFPPEDPDATVYRTLPARHIWQAIMSSTYEFAEPGFILIDRVNDMNNNWFCESIRATNPCGEQPLPAYGACLLGSLNLTRFVTQPFTAEASFDWQRFAEVAAVFTRMLDNVVEIDGLPLVAQRDELRNKRRHGMGFFGLGSALALLGMKYGSEDAASFTEQISRELAVTGWKAGLELAREKGMAPALEQDYEISAELLAQRPEMAADGISEGDRVPGRILHARYSRYMQRLATVEPELVEQLATEGCRFTHHSSVAPTGTIALSIGNNASNGIEPTFAHQYSRNVIKEGKKSKQKLDVFSYELLAYREMVNPEASPQAEDEVNQLPDYFVSTDDIEPEQHLLIQAAAQKWIDSSISKTINVPTDFPYEKFKDIYLQAYKNGLKGCTTFRFNPEVFQGVLVREEDIANTSYRFTLADGSVIEARGDEEIVYDGETHTAANLYDALKEGYYGKL